MRRPKSPLRVEDDVCSELHPLDTSTNATENSRPKNERRTEKDIMESFDLARGNCFAQDLDGISEKVFATVDFRPASFDSQVNPNPSIRL
jgi:hypothetical protein